MPENYLPPPSLFDSFVRQPDDVVGMVAFGLYHADEIAFIEQNLSDLTSKEALVYAIDIFRANATAQVEGFYRGPAAALVEAHFIKIKSASLSSPKLAAAIELVRSLVHDAEIGEAIKATAGLLAELGGQSERQQQLGMIASNYEFVQKTARKGVITFEETRIGHAVAADKILSIIGDVETEFGRK